MNNKISAPSTAATTRQELLKQFETGVKVKPVYYFLLMLAAAGVFGAALIIRYSVVDGIPFGVAGSRYLALSGLCFACLCLIYFLLKQVRSGVGERIKLFAACVAVITITLIISIFMEKISPFAMPATLAVLIIAIFTDAKVSFVSNTFTVLLLYLTLSAFSGFEEGDANKWFLSMMVFAVSSGTILSYAIKRDTKRLSFILNGVAFNMISLPILLLNVVLFDISMAEVLEVIPYTAVMIVGSVVLALIIQPVVEAIFNVNSNFRLMELCDHHRPLLARLAKEAPGTFNHSLTVANLAETCARAINENTYFVRAAAYYHDVGKLQNTRFFKENQISTANPHDELTPEVSVDIIKKHAFNGITVCDEYRIPREISVITAEHHGTMPIIYFYEKAKQLSDRTVDIDDYSYIGPTPSSKAAAIIMICDAAEATVRTLKSHDYQEVDKVVKRIIEERLTLGQFDNCGITMKELATIRETIVSAFGGLHHERIKYPELQLNENNK